VVKIKALISNEKEGVRKGKERSKIQKTKTHGMKV
jgi:hypothetical protein